MQAAHYTSLLPDVFRHKTTRVRVFIPQIILLDFHGTIIERRWEDRIIFPYVKVAVVEFLRNNWSNDQVQKCIPGLRNESFEQRFRYKYEDAPIIDDTTEGQDLDPDRLAGQMGEFIQWQMTNRRETKETQTIERLVWQDGFRRRKIAIPLYEDSYDKIKLWKEKYQCQIYVISSIDTDTLKLLFEFTTEGNLNEYLAGFVSSKKVGDKLISDTYKKFYDQVASSLIKRPLSPKRPVTKSPSGATSSLRSLASSSPQSGTRLSTKSPGSPSDIKPKPILFITDSGQEAKAASQVADGFAFECLLINRPGNKRFRTYYLSQFQYVDKFDDIEFV